MTDFWLIFHQSTIIHILGINKCLCWWYFFKSVRKVQSIDCLNVHFWAQTFFYANDRFLVVIHQSAIMHIFGPEKCLFWWYFFKSVQKVQYIDFPSVHSWVQNLFFANDKFLVGISSKHYYAHFLPKKDPVLGLFLQVSSKSTVYKLSKCAFLGPNFFFFNWQIFGWYSIRAPLFTF